MAKSFAKSGNRDEWSELRQLFEGRKLMTFDKDQCLFHENQPSSGIFLIQSGNVKLVKNKRTEHRKYILQFITRGELAGISSLVAPYYTHSAIAVETVKAQFIPRDALLVFLSENPSESFRFMKRICQHLEKIEARFSHHSAKTTRERVALALLTLDKKYGLDKNKFLNVPLTHTELASFSGITNGTLSRVLSDFEINSLINTKDEKIRLLNRQRLLEIVRL